MCVCQSEYPSETPSNEQFYLYRLNFLNKSYLSYTYLVIICFKYTLRLIHAPIKNK